MPTSKRLIFMGSPDFALAGLRQLIESPDFSVIAVFTQTDKPRGRRQQLSAPAVKKLALTEKIKVYQPIKIKTAEATIKKLKPDLIVVIAYGQIIPPAILTIPKYGCFNVHASLLPKYRGAACLPAPILNNDPETGITIMKMATGLDTGDILSQAKIKLTGQENQQTLADKLSQLGAKILPNTLKNYIDGKIKPQKQDETKASYVNMIKKEAGRINWQETNTRLERKTRAYHPWPGTFCQLPTGRNLKIIQVKIINNNLKLKPGQIKVIDKQIIIGTGQGNLQILKLQAAGQKIMTAEQFINGQSIDSVILN